MVKKIALVLACCIATSCAACSDDGRWDVIDACNDGEKRCDGSVIQICRDNQWLFESKCLGNTPLCNPQTFTCTNKPVVNECQGSEKKCAENAVWSCVNGKWSKMTECTPQQTCNPTTFACDDNANPDIACDKDGEKLALGSTYCGDDKTLYTCVEKDGSGIFEPKTCEGDTPVCGMNGATAACVAASTVKCAKDGDEYDLGAAYCGDDTTLYTCVEKDGAGVFEPTTCEGDTPVCGMNGETAACVAGSAVKCTKDGDENEYDLDSTYCGDDGKLYTCTEQEDGSGAFIASDCPAELPVCDLDEGNCRAYKTCSVDSTQIPHGGKTCVGDVVRLCDDGALEDDTDCAANDQVCDSATSSCIDKSPENCTVDSTTISNGATICIGIEKVACTNGTTTNEACTTTVENASPTCAMIESVATCGFACNDGYILSDDGSSCVEVAKFDAVLTIREAYDALVDSETCGSGATSNTVKHADVALTGVVTALRSMGFYVQDTTGGIFVSCKDKTCLKYADDTNVAIGDNVKVTSNGVGHYYCDLQVQALKDSSVSIEKLAPAQTVEPTTALIEDIAQDGAKNLNLGKLVVLSGLEAVSLDEHGNWKAKQGDAEINVTPTLIDKDILKTAMNVGKSYGITGIGVYAYNEVRLAPRMREDIVEECTEGTYLCNPETNEYQLCYWGQWMEAEPCSGFNFTASGGSNVYATEFACNAANDGCIITACAEGYQPTANSLACEAEEVPPTCTDGKMQCSGANDIQTCVDGSWATAVSCASTITHATTATCETTGDTAVCKATACDGGFVVSEDGLSCEAEVVPPTCTDGKMQCSGANDIQTCVDGSWATADSCVSLITNATAANCEASGDTAVCKVTACDEGFVPNADNSKCEPTAAPTTSLIISEVASISNSNGHAVKFVELYNAAESAVPLANCQLVVYKKASSTPDLTLQLDNSIDAGKTYVYCGSYANEAETDADLRAKCSSTDAANLNNLSTKRVIELQCDGNTIDITGKKGTELPHGSNIIRKCGITAGVTDPNVGAQATDWRSSTATIEGLKTTLGSHEAVCSE